MWKNTSMNENEVDNPKSWDCRAFGDLCGKAEWGTPGVLIIFLHDYFVVKLQKSWVGGYT